MFKLIVNEQGDCNVVNVAYLEALNLLLFIFRLAEFYYIQLPFNTPPTLLLLVTYRA